MYKVQPKRYAPELIGAIAGGAAGFARYYFFGCANGTCLLSSNPAISTVYGMVMGMLIFSFFKTSNHNKTTK
ncbi:MAG: hypothetical protein EBZ77_10440 [Chitinophagia bacterium]|nr:hypothetical protein [Chitinophagia bacterium]